MDMTVCAGTRTRLVITDHALISVQTGVGAQVFGEMLLSVAANLFGGALGGALASTAVSGDRGSPPARIQSVLNLGDGKPVPPLHHMQSVTTCFAAEVPPELSQSPGWPKFPGFRPVVFYPRTLISDVTVRWTGAVRATLSRGAEFETTIDPFSVWKARDALRRWGYPLR